MSKWYEYQAYVDIGFFGIERTEDIDLRDYNITQEEWKTMTEDEKSNFIEKNLIEVAEELKDNYLEYGIRQIAP